MQLQKQVSKRRGDRTYYKYVLVIPNKIVRAMKIKEGDEFKPSIKKKKLILKVLKKRKND